MSWEPRDERECAAYRTFLDQLTTATTTLVANLGREWDPDVDDLLQTIRSAQFMIVDGLDAYAARGRSNDNKEQ